MGWGGVLDTAVSEVADTFSVSRARIGASARGDDLCAEGGK